MKIDSYSFGRIVIDGGTYTKDITISPDGTIVSWWRREGHRLNFEDLEGILKAQLDALIIGTGSSGVMKVPGDLIEKLEGMGIDVIVERTGEACKIYNELQGRKRVGAAFHLTC